MLLWPSDSPFKSYLNPILWFLSPALDQVHFYEIQKQISIILCSYLFSIHILNSCVIRNFTTANTLTYYLLMIFLTNVILFEGTMRQTGFSTRLATSCLRCRLCLSCRGDLAWASVLAPLPIWHYWTTRCTPETSSYSWTTSHKRVLSHLSVKLWPHPSGKARARGP